MNLATGFCEQWQYPFCDQSQSPPDLQLDFGLDKTCVYDTQNHTHIEVDFISGALAHRVRYGGGRGQALAKAIGLQKHKDLHVLDATAGMGRDAYVLATLGCRLTLIEQSPVLYTLLADGIERAKQNDHFISILQQGFELIHGNAVELMRNRQITSADVVYLDPMYPERKKSALVKKEMQTLQKLLGHDEINNNELLNTALEFATQRVVVKRPKGALPLAGPKITMSIESKKTRYDVYVIKALES